MAQRTKNATTFKWDDYSASTSPRSGKWASTDRGWARRAPMRDNRFDASYPVGNYLDYGPTAARGPNGETVHAVAYYGTVDAFGHPTMQTANLGSSWHTDTASARQWIETTVKSALATAKKPEV